MLTDHRRQSTKQLNTCLVLEPLLKRLIDNVNMISYNRVHGVLRVHSFWTILATPIPV